MFNMEQIIDYIINNILSNFDFRYMLSVNVLTYIVIKVIDELNKEKKVSTLIKRVVLVISIILISIVYKLIGYDNNIELVNSAILAPVFWSWIAKPICSKLGINYKQINDVLK